MQIVSAAIGLSSGPHSREALRARAREWLGDAHEHEAPHEHGLAGGLVIIQRKKSPAFFA